YQASFLTFISDYALGYQVLRESDPVTAARYADKAISMIKSGLHDYQKGDSVATQFLARGNGLTRTFILPVADIVPDTMVDRLAAGRQQADLRPPAHRAAGGHHRVHPRQVLDRRLDAGLPAEQRRRWRLRFHRHRHHLHLALPRPPDRHRPGLAGRIRRLPA